VQAATGSQKELVDAAGDKSGTCLWRLLSVAERSWYLLSAIFRESAGGYPYLYPIEAGSCCRGYFRGMLVEAATDS
jgi:hypothetical protein